MESRVISEYPLEIVVKIKGHGRETEVFSLELVDGRVVCDCDHHEQCGEVCDNLPAMDTPAQEYGVALQVIIETIALDIGNGDAPYFVGDEP